MKPYTHKQHEKQVEVIILAGYDPARFVGVEHQWWYNPINHNSLRLTHVGFKWFTQHAKLKSYEIKLPEDQKILPKHYLQLEKLFEEPYYIKGRASIVVFGERDAVMLQLHAGDLTSYLNNLESNQ